MRVIVLCSALLLLAVGTYSYFTYGTANQEPGSGSALNKDQRYGPFDELHKGKKKSVFFIEFGGAEETTDVPAPAVPTPSAVQANPHTR